MRISLPNPVARTFMVLAVTLFNLFPASAMAGVVTFTGLASFEAAVPYGATVIPVSFSGTPGATVASGSAFTGLTLASVYGQTMTYSGDGSSLCLTGGGTVPRFEVYTSANTSALAADVTVSTGTLEFGSYDLGGTYQGYTTTTTSGFVGLIADDPSAEFPIIGESSATICLTTIYLVPDYDSDGTAGDLDCDEVDQDGDGADNCGTEDCDDADASIYSGATEVPYNGIDEDCDSSTLDDDLDGDSYPLATDCDDDNSSINPVAAEVCDGSDNNCDGTVDETTSCYDDDGDGVTEDAGDCDDSDPTIYSGATELCDGINQDCLGDISDEADADGDTYRICAGDCDDSNSGVNPGVSETAYNGIDDDCSSATPDDDLDGDSYPLATDCDDDNSSINPGVSEVPYNGIDDDCDVTTLEDDLDEDGYSYTDGSDCDDTDSGINPGAAEVAYDGIDQDCDGADLDDVDGDGESYPTDCNDANSAVYTTAAELCNGLDENCDSVTDEGYPDSDGDGTADCMDTDLDGDGYTPAAGDCDDADPTINPAASDIPDNGVDEDCSGADLSDADGDGYGTADGDCDDSDLSIHPNADEICDGVDQDCDGTVDEDPTDGSIWYADSDSDGYGETTSTKPACSQPTDYVATAGDCNDSDASIHPNAEEVPDNGIDEDCDGEDAVTDPGDDDTGDDDSGDDDSADPTDNDGDGWTNSDDCDDNNNQLYPGAMEVNCDDLDQDCDGEDDCIIIVTGSGGCGCNSQPVFIPTSLMLLISVVAMFRRRQ